MISVIICAYDEPKTIGEQIEAFLDQHYPLPYEILVCASDTPTFKAANKYAKNKQVKVYKDKRLGKPHALNLLMKKAKGDIFIFSDGDVLIDKDAVHHLMQPFQNPKIGAVTGRPVSISPRDTKFGYWSHLLTDIGAHKTRIREATKNKYIDCSGYLYAVRAVIKKIPDNCLSDDAYMGHAIHSKGYKIAYAPKAKVYVKYPDNYNDWILQKRRSGGGVHQIKYYFPQIKRMRSLNKELLYSLTAFSYPQTVKELIWTFQLFAARLHLWKEIHQHITKNSSLQKLWKPVESTK